MNRGELAHRAEQALLGGLAAGGDHGPVRAIMASDFTDPRHQAIFLALTGRVAGASRPAALGDRLDRAGRRAADAAAYMDSLPARCPDPRHLSHYAAMVAQHAQAARPAPRQAAPAMADGQLASAGAELEQLTARGRRPATPPGVTPDVARLARVLRPVGLARSAQWRQAAAERLARPRSRERTQADLRDMVLASLLRHPADGLGLALRVEPGELFDGTRRPLYELLRARLLARQDADPLIIAWEATQASHRDGVPAIAQLALALGDVRVTPGTARVLGRALLADAVLSAAVGDNWTRVPGLAGRLQLPADSEPAALRDPGPAAARGQDQWPAPSAAPYQRAAAMPAPTPRLPEPGSGTVPRA